MPESPLVLESLGHAYGETPVFEGVDLEVAPGELVAVLGASGSGKTTLLRAVAGFVTPSLGAIHVGGRRVVAQGREHVSAERREIGMVFQDYALFPHMDVRQNIDFGLHGAARELRRRRVDELLALVGLAELGERRPAQLSGGQQQRVALARALAPRPRLLLLDEPFANLDAALRRGMATGVRDILDAEGVSGLLVTHDRAEALCLADRVAVLGAAAPGAPGPARLLQCAAPEEIYLRPTTALVATLTGEALIIDAEASGSEASSALGTIPLGRPAGGAVKVALRPEALRFVPREGGPLTVTARRFQGARYDLGVATPIGELALEWVGGGAPERGTTGDLQILAPGWPLG